MGQLAPRDFSFSDIYALNRKPNTAGFCLLSPHGIISSFQELRSVSESASLSLVSFKFPMTLEEMPRIAPASQPSRAGETAAQKPAFMESCGELIQKPHNSVQLAPRSWAQGVSPSPSLRAPGGGQRAAGWHSTAQATATLRGWIHSVHSFLSWNVPTLPRSRKLGGAQVRMA